MKPNEKKSLKEEINSTIAAREIAISLAAIVEFISSFNDFFSLGFIPLFVGLITSFLSSLVAIDFLLKYFSANGLKIFIIYRVIFGVVILLNL